MTDELTRYNHYGWDYEYFNPLTDKGIAWYLKWAQKTGGPILELACGTGRLMLEIAKAGFEIDGIDLSGTMLDIARKRIAMQPQKIQSRIRLVNADMSNFELDSRYGMIVIADNSFRELKTTAQQRSCLQHVYRHLRSDGIFLMTERCFNLSKFVHGKCEYPWSNGVQNPQNGDWTKRKISLSLAPDRKSIRGTMIYQTIHADGSESIESCPFMAPLMQQEEYLSLLSDSGFSTTTYNDYQELLDNSQRSILCFVSTKN
jgi:ubiquinone/menaquinone biosynthesis C-methylase UbiE